MRLASKSHKEEGKKEREEREEAGKGGGRVERGFRAVA